MTDDVLVRPAVISERQDLEELQRRASLNNPGDREALLAHPDAIELPAEQIAAGQVFVVEVAGRIAGFAAIKLREKTETTSSTRSSWSPSSGGRDLGGS